jgi:hypothetical protein
MQAWFSPASTAGVAPANAGCLCTAFEISRDYLEVEPRGDLHDTRRSSRRD